MAMADPAQEMIQFVTSLPLSTNPYVALAVNIKESTRIAKPVLWGLVFRRIFALQFCILCCQAMAVLWLRKKANKLHFFRVNKLGLIHVEVLNEIVVLMLVFSVSNYLISFFFFPIISIKITGSESESELVAVIDLVTQEFVEQGSLVFSKKLILRTCKFPIAANKHPHNITDYKLAYVRLFLWICGIETVMSFSSLRARARAGASIRLPRYVRLFANGTLLAVLIIPGGQCDMALVMEYNALMADHCFNSRDRKRGDRIVEILLKAAPTYTPATYNPLMQHLLIATLYVPTSFYALRGLRNQTIPESVLKPSTTGHEIEEEEGALRPEYQLQIMSLPNMKTPAEEMEDQEKVRKRLVIHACLLYLDTLSYKGIRFFNDPTWVLIEQLGTHGHTALIGNIILALLIKNTIYANKKFARSTNITEKATNNMADHHLDQLERSRKSKRDRANNESFSSQ
ncbi:hypothetical protein PSTT_10730 [Puccinia striiformis]|uniref:Uncharacterized protein n=1 Tax=Puccinia striiformis TaxID=27350 RepID=A0A2S4V328_9BASI|nr:hypothetical protein PSTT_10730 [Puccinia striiformis]